ncbi:putative lipoprotein LppJ [Mycobacterium kiyosense]|uniref:Lipoprotein LppJ n=2 Tax=Mycobacteriaceae TaxID=1762 RepID=A0AA37V436_9MYCO|nr:putative lipoprotein LppJ [Mycobacterium kiyosense]BDE14240.1 putative lipoprotein LppJ [Mycobacterium sp. 20KCMC460]GLB81544.1 putative lipoprotein LppJ [Mycobacterium kiyosense]GLB90141.1 putative lipoprotein LppJ [Mycobacterium kiyosense]GLB93737.1 putative lipoprotein LppJ [Mycobacterium kiyosense]
MRTDWLRTRQTRLLIAASLAISLVLGGAFLALDQLHSTPADAIHAPDHPATDQQSRDQAVDAAKNIVAVARLHPTSAGYLLMSCRDRDSAPYQGAVYLTFTLPADTRADTYLPGVAAQLTSDGWIEGLPPANHAFGRTLTKNTVTVIIYRHDDDPGLGVLRLYGECRNMTDHRGDATAWIDVTDQFGR